MKDAPSPEAENGRFGARAEFGQRAVALRGSPHDMMGRSKYQFLIRLLTLQADAGDRGRTPKVLF
jgi:hypothetical protein